MAIEINYGEFEGRPALLALSTPEYIAVVNDVLKALGYKPVEAAHHEDFLSQFAHVQYEVVVIEENFLCDTPAENRSLAALQQMPASRRRHAVVFLLSELYPTLHTLYALQQSVTAVIHRDDLDSIGALIQQQVAETALFQRTFRETQLGISQGRL